MAKVVIIAPADVDVKDAVKVLKGDGHDVDVEEPTPKTLLHIVLGLLGTNAYGFGSQYAFVTGGGTPPPEEEEEEPAEEIKEEPEPEPEPEVEEVDDFHFESVQLGKVKVDGELIEAVSIDNAGSRLCVPNLVTGTKISYRLNESDFSFWATDQNVPIQRVVLEINDQTISKEVVLADAAEPRLEVGADLIELFNSQ